MFYILKQALLRCKTAAFNVQNRHFYKAKQWVLQHADSENVIEYNP